MLLAACALVPVCTQTGSRVAAAAAWSGAADAIADAPGPGCLPFLLTTDADPGGCLNMGDLAELLLAMPEAEDADET